MKNLNTVFDLLIFPVLFLKRFKLLGEIEFYTFKRALVADPLLPSSTIDADR